MGSAQSTARERSTVGAAALAALAPDERDAVLAAEGRAHAAAVGGGGAGDDEAGAGELRVLLERAAEVDPDALVLAVAAALATPAERFEWAWSLTTSQHTGGSSGGAGALSVLLRAAAQHAVGYDDDSRKSAAAFAEAVLTPLGTAARDEAAMRKTLIDRVPATLPSAAAAARLALGVPIPRGLRQHVPRLELGQGEASGSARGGAPLLQPVHAWQLAFAAPTAVRTARAWTRVYSSKAGDGTSLTTLAKRAEAGAPVLVVVKSLGGKVVAGLSAEPLTRGAAFSGSAGDLVASLAPHLSIYRATGYAKGNGHVLFALGLESVPPGLGFGGQAGFHALHIGGGGDVLRAHSRATAAFANPVLFEEPGDDGTVGLEAAEVWECGEPNDEWLRTMYVSTTFCAAMSRTCTHDVVASAGADWSLPCGAALSVRNAQAPRWAPARGRARARARQTCQRGQVRAGRRQIQRRALLAASERAHVMRVCCAHIEVQAIISLPN